MEKSQSRRYTHGGSSPRMLRSKSSTTAAFSVRPKKEAKKIKEEAAAAADGGGLVRFLPRSKSKVEVPRRTRSASTSPSAWALSPGRPQPAAPPPVPKSPAGGQKSVRSGMSGVLKYFRPKKVSPVLEEEYHQFRLVYNRLLQWRFANARAAASTAAANRAAQEKLLNAWVRVAVMRKVKTEMRSEIQKLKQDMKMWHILSSQMEMLNDWSRIEARNFEAVSRVVRKLSAISLCLPLHHNAQVDIMSLYDAISAASEVMDNIKATIIDMYRQAEKTCFLLTELSIMIKQYKPLFQELEKPLALVASLEAEERSMRVHRIQLVKESG